MNYRETPHTFSVAADQSMGIAALPETPGDCGVIVVVGGPQYRVGSHRQFLLLSRRLAAEGYPVFRFDYRGMGDSRGARRDFDDVSEDIRAAIDAFHGICPGLKRIVLWGLCDAASACLIYTQAFQDARVDGLVLLNPWVRSEASLAQTQIKHYYGQRLLQREFWLKLFGGKLNLFSALREFLHKAAKAKERPSANTSEVMTFQEKMAEGVREFKGRILLILSGQDYTAKEFLDHASANKTWAEALATGRVERIDIPEADHTFSSAIQRSHVEKKTLRWLDGAQSG